MKAKLQRKGFGICDGTRRRAAPVTEVQTEAGMQQVHSSGQKPAWFKISGSVHAAPTPGEGEEFN